MTSTRSPGFSHERLNVYQKALDLMITLEETVNDLPKGWSDLANQARRASLSIVLNIAEGAGEYSPRDKSRFFRMAKRSATECAAIVAVLQKIELGSKDRLDTARRTLLEVVSMLTGLSRRWDGEKRLDKDMDKDMDK